MEIFPVTINTVGIRAYKLIYKMVTVEYKGEVSKEVTVGRAEET